MRYEQDIDELSFIPHDDRTHVRKGLQDPGLDERRWAVSSLLDWRLRGGEGLSMRSTERRMRKPTHIPQFHGVFPLLSSGGDALHRGVISNAINAKRSAIRHLIPVMMLNHRGKKLSSQPFELRAPSFKLQTPNGFSGYFEEIFWLFCRLFARIDSARNSHIVFS